MLMWFNILLILVLIICVITDIKSRRIYNKIIFPALFIGFLSHFVLYGLSGLYFSFIGFFVGLMILMIPYLLGGIGAGDVKLLALIGALKGSSFVLYTSIYMAISGGILAALILIYQRNFFSSVKSIFYRVLSLPFGGKISIPEENSILSNTYPYGVAITIGAFTTFIFMGRLVLW